jgi:beta-N-acetylhexosaminidase
LGFNFVTKLLREQLGFKNLIITDDLEMGAIVNNYGIGEACKMAIKSGEDLLAICANENAVREGFYAVLDAVNKNEISESRIDQSLERIFNIKSKIKQPLPFDSVRLQELSNKIAELNAQLKYSYGG